MFQSRDSETDTLNLEHTFSHIKTSKLTNSTSHSIQGPLTLNEISQALKRMKNNKTPGSDGFPADFFKIFWNKLKIFVLRSLNYSFEQSELSVTMRHCIISCLPKGTKPREFLKNWRPISLLNVTYKICSSAIALRIRSTIDPLISSTQSGFLQNRFIGESTRLIYDVMHYCENHNIDGLLMLIDFEKAFDSVSWNFMYQVLDFFNYGKDIISWIKLFNHNINASILQCGHLSESFPIQRGCRQGDPISSYLFILCAQILYLMVTNNMDIKGITIGTHDYY